MGLAGSSSTKAGTAAAKVFVQQVIEGSPVVVFSKTYCPYCVKAKQALGQFLPAEQITVIELNQRSDLDEDAVIDALADLTGGSTVPRVFVGGKFIGGGDDTAAKARNGELKQLLTAQGLL